jgi:hypothetical protein
MKIIVNKAIMLEDGTMLKRGKKYTIDDKLAEKYIAAGYVKKEETGDKK